MELEEKPKERMISIEDVERLMEHCPNAVAAWDADYANATLEDPHSEGFVRGASWAFMKVLDRIEDTEEDD